MQARRTFATGIGVLICIALMCGCGQYETEAHPQAAAAPPTVQYLGQWGAKGDGPGKLDQPAGIATDTNGNVYIADAGSQFIHKLDPQGTPLLSFQEGALKHPQWITIDGGGAMYVSDPVRNSVFVFLPNGDKYRELHLKTRADPENEISVAVGDDGLIHILDWSAEKVFTYTSSMRLAQNWAPSVGAAGATSATGANHHLGPIVRGPEDSLYFADASGGRILRYSRDGQFVSAIDASADGTQRKLSREFAVSSSCVLAMDADGHTLHVWTLDGKLKLDTDLAAELGPGSRLPPAIAVSPRSEMLVLDAPQARVLRYHINF
jgi:DNA-binding beta-propeller fold protein YncE